MHARNRLNSVAHNLPAWFDSSMNFGSGPHGNGLAFLAGEAEAFPDKCIEIDVLAKISKPPLEPEARHVLEVFHSKLTEFLAKEGFALDALASATVQYDFGVDRPRAYRGAPVYDCACKLVEHDGRVHVARLDENHGKSSGGPPAV